MAGGVRIGYDTRDVTSPAKVVLAEEEEVVQRRASERSARVIVGTHEQVVCGAAIIHRNCNGVINIRAVARPHSENSAADRVKSGQRDALVPAEIAERPSGQVGLVDLVPAVNSRITFIAGQADLSLNSRITLDSVGPLISRKTGKT